MSSYKRVIIYIFLILFVIGCTRLSQPKKDNLSDFKYTYKTFALEDRYIMFALEYNNQGQKDSAKELFYELYNNTLKEEYLLEYSKLSFCP